MSRGPVRAALAISILCLLASAIPASATGPGFHFEQVLGGLKRPTYVAAHSDPNLLYILEEKGRIIVLRRDDGGAPWQSGGVFLDMRSLVSGPYYTRGLLGMAFDPGYAVNGKFYVFYTRRSTDPVLNGDIVVAEYTRLTNLQAKPRSRRTVLVVPHDSQFHFGGWLGFGPDGYMYMTTGDAAHSTPIYPQDINSRLGKVLRFNPHAKNGKAAQIPSGNPFVGTDGDDMVWAYGLRNPWRASFDRASGALWLPDVGESLWEEVNRFTPAASARGANLGWGICEGTHAYPEPVEGPTACGVAGTVSPVVEYGHTDGNCSVIGGYVYRGTSQPNLVGRYFYGDFCTGNVWSIPSDLESGMAVDPPVVLGRHINSFGEDASGEIYVAAGDGTIWHVVQD